jgi:hypothetical protein
MGVAGEGHAPLVLPQETETYPLYGGLGGPLENLWKGDENIAPTLSRSPDRPGCIESLYRLHHPGPLTRI